MTHYGTQTLTPGPLTLRRFIEDDAEAMYRNWASDPEVTRYLTWEPHADFEATRRILNLWIAQYESDGYYHWAITLQAEPIGAISVVSANTADEYAEIGYCLSHAHWGKGYMTEALRAVLGYLFETVGVHRIVLKHDAANIGSGRVMIKNGMTYEGTLRGQHHRRDGTWGDLLVYGMLRDEWLERNRK